MALTKEIKDTRKFVREFGTSCLRDFDKHRKKNYEQVLLPLEYVLTDSKTGFAITNIGGLPEDLYFTLRFGLDSWSSGDFWGTLSYSRALHAYRKNANESWKYDIAPSERVDQIAVGAEMFNLVRNCVGNMRLKAFLDDCGEAGLGRPALSIKGRVSTQDLDRAMKLVRTVDDLIDLRLEQYKV